MAQTVLRLLALNAGVPMHREVLVETLWGDLRESAGRHNLHVAVSSLRGRFEQLLPGQSRALLARLDQAYVFAPGSHIVTDLQRLEALLGKASRCRQAGDRLAQIDALRAAVDSYAGDLLPADGPAEWVVGIRERTRLAVAEAASRLAVLELERGRPGGAVDAAAQSVRLDPWRDSSWRLLIDANRRAGDQVKARKAAQEYRAMLKSLGVAMTPEPALTSAPRAPANHRAERLARPG